MSIRMIVSAAAGGTGTPGTALSAPAGGRMPAVKPSTVTSANISGLRIVMRND